MTSASKAPQCRGCGTCVPARIREQAASDEPVAAAISASVNVSSFGRDLALEPRPVALARVPASPAAIAAVPLADCFASHAIHRSAATRIGARSCLRRKRLAGPLDSAETVLAPRLGHARLAVSPPALEHRLAAERARDRISRPSTPQTQNGNIPPIQTISGSKTGLTEPLGITVH